MAGHSQFKNIMYRKGAQDKKRAKVFTKIIRETHHRGAQRPARPQLPIRGCARRSPRPRQPNMPKDTIERAIKRGAGGEGGENYDEIRYEGYGPGGVAVIVEALTDNRNRTASEVRAAFTKAGGNLGESNSVSFLFDRLGEITLSRRSGLEPTRCSRPRSRPAPTMSRAAPTGTSSPARPTRSTRLRDALERRFGPPAAARLVWKPKTLAPVERETAEACSSCSRRWRTATTCRTCSPISKSPTTSWRV